MAHFFNPFDQSQVPLSAKEFYRFLYEIAYGCGFWVPVLPDEPAREPRALLSGWTVDADSLAAFMPQIEDVTLAEIAREMAVQGNKFFKLHWRNDRFSRPTRPQLHQLRQMIDSHKREHGPTWLEDVNNRVSLVHLAQDTLQIIALARQIEARLEYLATEPIPVVDETWWFHWLENLG